MFCFFKRILIVLTYKSLVQCSKNKNVTQRLSALLRTRFFLVLVSMVRGQAVLGALSVAFAGALKKQQQKKSPKTGSTPCPRQVQTPAQASPSANSTSSSISCLHLRYSATWESSHLFVLLGHSVAPSAIKHNGISIDQPASKRSITTVEERQERHNNCTPSGIFANGLKVHLMAVLQCVDKTMDVVELLMSNCIYINVTHILKRINVFFGHFPNGKCYASFFCFVFFLPGPCFVFRFLFSLL